MGRMGGGGGHWYGAELDREENHFAVCLFFLFLILFPTFFYTFDSLFNYFTGGGGGIEIGVAG